MRTAIARAALLLLLAAAACSKGRSDNQQGPPDFASRFPSTHYLQFLNRQPSLAAGNYSLVAATEQPGQSGSFSMTAGFDDGTSTNFSGTWTASGGPSPTASGNPSFPIVLSVPGGLSASLTGSVPTHLYLLDRAGNVVADAGAGGDTADPNQATLALPSSQTDSTAYSTAYYNTIDPSGTRDTLPKWLAANGFAGGDTAHVVFLDVVDLGYGRNMHMLRRADGGIAVYVQNYQVNNVPGQQYGPLNLDAAIDEDLQYQRNTNALEWGPITDSNGQPVDLNGDGTIDQADFLVQFYTFDAQPPYERQLTVDMDGAGNKAMPVPCIVCHGGRADPVLPNGAFPHSGDLRAYLQPLDPDFFDYSSRTGYARSDLEPGLKLINQAVYDSYAPYLPPTTKGIPDRWDSTAARALLESWYGGPGLPNALFDSSAAVPAGWQANTTATPPTPANATQLYGDIESVYCRSCHLLRNSLAQDDIGFSTYQAFIGYSPVLQERVYDQGLMPLAQIQSDLFFTSPTLPSELASLLPGFSDYAPDGSVNLPGRPVAVAPPPYTGPSPVALSGAASQFAAQYQWSVVSAPAGASASFDNPASVRPVLSAAPDGSYVVQLVVSDGVSRSPPVTVAVTIDSTLATPPDQLTFEADIKPILQGTDPVYKGGCVACHSATTKFPYLPPIFYTDPAPGENRDLYLEVRARVNLADPLNSPLLTKPAGLHHGGFTRPGFNLATGDRASYDRFLAWIAAGAREQ